MVINYKMKIAIISTFLGQKWSGAEISSFLLAKNLSKKENVFVVTSKIDGKMPFRCYSMPLLKYVPNIALLIGHGAIDWYMAKQMMRIFRKERPDVAHIQDYAMMSAALRAAKRIGIPCIFTTRSYQFVCNLAICLEQNQIRFDCGKKEYFKCLKKSIKEAYGKRFVFLGYVVYPWFYRQMRRMRENFRKMGHYIAVSDFVRRQMIIAGIDGKRITTINVPKEDWRPIEKKSSEKIIFSAGGLKRTKGFHYLIRSFKKVTEKEPDAKLRIAGEGSAKKELDTMVKGFGLERNVCFLGKISHDRMQEEYANASFVVSPSLWPEPLTRIIFEAFSMKKTVIATDVGGSRELVVNGKTGLLVKAGDEKEMANAMNKLMENEDMAKRMGENGYKLVVDESNEEKVCREHINVYKSGKNEINVKNMTNFIKR